MKTLKSCFLYSFPLLTLFTHHFPRWQRVHQVQSWERLLISHLCIFFCNLLRRPNDRTYYCCLKSDEFHVNLTCWTEPLRFLCTLCLHCGEDIPLRRQALVIIRASVFTVYQSWVVAQWPSVGPEPEGHLNRFG